MKNTIIAKSGYRARKVQNITTGEFGYKIYDGEELLLIAHETTYDDYKYNKEYNEMFNFCEVFTTVKGNQFIYWRDEEINTDYITKINITNSN